MPCLCTPLLHPQLKVRELYRRERTWSFPSTGKQSLSFHALCIKFTLEVWHSIRTKARTTDQNARYVTSIFLGPNELWAADMFSATIVSSKRWWPSTAMEISETRSFARSADILHSSKNKMKRWTHSKPIMIRKSGRPWRCLSLCRWDSSRAHGAPQETVYGVKFTVSLAALEAFLSELADRSGSAPAKRDPRYSS